MIDGVAAEATRILYRQARNSAAAALVVTIYMALIAWPYSSHTWIVIWLLCQALAQVGRIGLIAAFDRAGPADERLPRWALYYTIYMALAGLLWGSSAFLFMHDDEPITIALTLCGLYGITGGSVPGNAYNPPGLYVFALTIFGCVLVRMLDAHSLVYAALGSASFAFAGIMILFCRVQAASIAESIRIRFENRALVAELQAQTAIAEAARAEAERASLMKSQFLAAASHDLRQPLHALGLLTGTLSPSTPTPTRTLDGIKANLVALERLFSGLLDIAKLDAGLVPVARQPVSVDDLFDQLEFYLRPTSTELGLSLRFRSDGVTAFTDPALIEQILLNLATNALRNTAQGGVLIAARMRQGRVRFEVWDTGCGIAPGDYEHIFEEFVQLGNPERNRRKGMGLGLAIVRRSARLLGTEVQVASVPDRGSLFHFTQPPGEEAPAFRPPHDDAAQHISIAGVPVLVIDDDVAVRGALTELLAAWRVDAAIAASIAEAKALLATRNFVAIIADHRLPGTQSGLDFLVETRRSLGDAAPLCWLATGDLDAALLARANEAGIPVLDKPVQPERLRNVIAGAARRNPTPAVD